MTDSLKKKLDELDKVLAEGNEEKYSLGHRNACWHEAHDHIPRLLRAMRVLVDAVEYYAERDVYAKPDDWRYAKEGGPPSFDDCEEVSGIASESLKEAEKILAPTDPINEETWP